MLTARPNLATCCLLALFFCLPPGDEDVDDLEDGDEDGDGLVGSADGGIAGDVHGEVVVDDAATALAGDDACE